MDLTYSRLVGVPIKFTEAAASKVKEILQNYYEDTGIQGYVQLGIIQKGCSGLSYDMTIVNSIGEKDIFLQQELISIKSDSLMWMIGTEVDYETKDTSAGFVFRNPNEKRACHCGAAFYV